MEYMGEFNLLEWTGEYFIQIPSGFKEKGLKACNIMEILREVLTAKEIDQLDDMESLSASLPLKKKTAKEVMKRITKDAADQGMEFLVDALIESVFDIDMSSNIKDSIFSELFKLVMDEEERSYIASIGKYDKDQLFFESVVPTSQVIQLFFKTEYEADFFVAHIALNSFEVTGDFCLEHLEECFLAQVKSMQLQEEEAVFLYKKQSYPVCVLAEGILSYNMFMMTLDFEKKDQ